MYIYAYPPLPLIEGGAVRSRFYAPSESAATTNQPPKILDRLRHVLRVKHYSYRTEQAYVAWSRQFILFHGKRHPQEMRAAEMEQSLSELAVARNVAASKNRRRAGRPTPP